MTDAERLAEAERRNLTRCETCGVPLEAHTAESCSRHPYAVALRDRVAREAPAAAPNGPTRPAGDPTSPGRPDGRTAETIVPGARQTPSATSNPRPDP